MLRRLVAPIALGTALALAANGCSRDDGRITQLDAAATTTSLPGGGPTTAATTTTGLLGAAPGTADLADAVMPGAGNGGYDVEHYDLLLEVGPDRVGIVGTTTIEATATQDLSEFNLDLSGLTVDGLTVDDDVATTAHEDEELVVTPATPIAAGADFTVVVRYSGTPEPVEDPSAPGTIGWLRADTGTYVASEPTGAMAFFPCNNHPSDKATFTISVVADAADTVVANGTLTSKEPTGDRTRWTFDQTDPMATYLVQVAVGDYDLVESTGPHGLPIRHAVVRHVDESQREVLNDTAPQLEYFEGLFGPYPFDAYGLLVADSLPEFALETQTLTLLPAEWLGYGRESASGVMAHELAHQWFGDAVTPSRWSDIWLNEGFATYGEWLWNDHVGARELSSEVTEAMDQAPRWREAFGPVAQPAAPFLFSPNQYAGAAIVLQALRLTVGDGPFFEILRTWVAEHGGGSATTDDFEALAGRVAGRDLDAFFDSWLRSATLPAMPG